MGFLRASLKAGALAGVASSCLVWQSAVAAEQPAAAGRAEAAELTEVVVTARKREESMQSVPLAVTVQTGEILKQHQITDAYSLQTLTPSLGAQASVSETGAPSFTIRGIGTAVAGIQVESSVGLVIDDIPMARVQLANIEFFDIDRVEVLRGPQGMLFGKNAAAGLINITTANPKFNTTEFIVHGQYGSLNTPTVGNSGKVDLAGNIPISDNAALRITGYYSRSPGYIKNVHQDQDFGQNSLGARVKFRWEPTDWARVLLTTDFSHVDGPGEGIYAPRFDNPGGPVQALSTADGLVASAENNLQASNAPNHTRFSTVGVALKTEFDVGGGYTLTNVAGYRSRRGYSVVDNDALSAPVFDHLAFTPRYQQTTEELRISSPAGQRFTFQGGVFYLHFLATNWFNYAGDLGHAVPPGFTDFVLFQQNFGTGGDSAAAFFESQYKITDDLHLTTGVRYTHDTLNYSRVLVNFPGHVAALLPDATIGTKAQKDNLSWRASLDYQIRPAVMAYASYALGYKGPTFDQLSGRPVGAEYPSDYELGLKSTFLDNRLRLNVTLFDETFNGFQAQAIDNNTVTTVNAGKLKARGVEVEFAAVPVTGLTISGGLTYNKTKYVGLNGIPCYPNEPVGSGSNQCMSNPTAPPVPPLNGAFYPFGVSSANGNQLAQAPKWTETVTARYEHPLVDRWNGFIQGDGYFRSSYNFSALNDPQTQIGSTAIFNMNVGVQSDDGRMGVALFVRNLTDKRVPIFITQSSIGPTLGDIGPGNKGDYWQQFGADSYRTIGFTVDYRM